MGQRLALRLLHLPAPRSHAAPHGSSASLPQQRAPAARAPRCTAAVDDQNYHHEAVLYFYLTWRDPSAYATVREATDEWLGGRKACQRPCTDWAGVQSCCDGIYLPTFFFRCWRACASSAGGSAAAWWQCWR